MSGNNIIVNFTSGTISSVSGTSYNITATSDIYFNNTKTHLGTNSQITYDISNYVCKEQDVTFTVNLNQQFNDYVNYYLAITRGGNTLTNHRIGGLGSFSITVSTISGDNYIELFFNDGGTGTGTGQKYLVFNWNCTLTKCVHCNSNHG